MKKLLYLIIPIALIGCDDGDLILDDLEFGSAAVEACPIPIDQPNNSYLFYIVDNTDNETISLNINTGQPILTQTGVYGPFPLTSNRLEYRKLNGPAGTDYYCSDVPPSSPLSTQIFIGEAGLASVASTIIEDDDDGVDAIAEGINLNDLSNSLDTDGDGLPDYIDLDDDNDNIPTSEELHPTDPSIIVDTDGDGTPNYRDNDDDNDGIDTIQETINLIGGIPNHLNNQVSVAVNPPINEYIEHRYTTTTSLEINITDLTAASNDRQIIIADYNFGTYLRTLTTLITPDF